MADEPNDIPSEIPGDGDKGGTALKEKPARKQKPKRKGPGHLPVWKVLLHNDDDNDMEYVIETILMLTPLEELQAKIAMKEAHDEGVALLLTTHRERAELYKEQFESRGLTVTIEEAE